MFFYNLRNIKSFYLKENFKINYYELIFIFIISIPWLYSALK